MREFPRQMEQRSGFSVESLLFGLFSRDQLLESSRTHFHGANFDSADSLLRGNSADYDDVGMYIGPVVAGLFVLGLVIAGRKHWKWTATFVLFLWLSLGERPSLSLFALLHELPVFESMRYAERFRLIWLLCLCLFACFGLHWLRACIERLWPHRHVAIGTVSALLALVLVDLFVVTRPIYERAFPIAPLALPRSPEFRQVSWLKHYDKHGFMQESRYDVYSSWSAHYPALLMNLGAVRCYETAFVPRKPTPMTEPGYRGEVYLVGTAGSVQTLEWSPNRLRYRVEAAGRGKLVINQNFYPGWRATDGRPLSIHDALLAVDVTPKDRIIELYYHRSSFYIGAAISLLSWLALIALQRRAAPKR
jgi:hypothetical protein